MFEPWQRFDARKAAALMNEHRITLRREHADLRKPSQVGGSKSCRLSERINSLRQKWMDAHKDQIRVCRALSRQILTINLIGYANALSAQKRLFGTCNKVAQTLQQLRAW
jgi:hypothetical protein